MYREQTLFQIYKSVANKKIIENEQNGNKILYHNCIELRSHVIDGKTMDIYRDIENCILKYY